MLRRLRKRGKHLPILLALVSVGLIAPSKESRACPFCLYGAVVVVAAAAAAANAYWNPAAAAPASRPYEGGTGYPSDFRQPVPPNTDSALVPGEGGPPPPPVAEAERALRAKIVKVVGKDVYSEKSADPRNNAPKPANGQSDITKNAQDDASFAAEAAKAMAAAARQAAKIEKNISDGHRDLSKLVSSAGKDLNQRLSGASQPQREKILNEQAVPHEDAKDLYNQTGLRTNKDVLDKAESFSKGLEAGADYHNDQAKMLEEKAAQAEEAARILREHEQKLAGNSNNFNSLDGSGGVSNAHLLPGTASEKGFNIDQALSRAKGGKLARGPGAENGSSEITSKKIEKLNPAAKSGITAEHSSKLASDSEEAEVGRILAAGKYDPTKKPPGTSGQGQLLADSLASASLKPKEEALLDMVKSVEQGRNLASSTARNLESEGTGSVTGETDVKSALARNQANVTIFAQVTKAIERCQVRNLDCIH